MNSGASDQSLVSFTASGPTLLVQDEVEGKTLSITLDSTISLQPALVELFHFPVDAAVSFQAEEFSIGPHANVLLRDESGDIVAEAAEDPHTARRGTYYLDISGPVNTYIRLPDVEPTIRYTGEQYESPVSVTLASPSTVTVGARSGHSRPEATITVPDDPVARMEAFSYLGSPIKEFSPERSWPTLRGHPPRFERGSDLDVPDSLAKPDTGVRVTVPPNHADLYRVAPLAFYLGATIEPGDESVLHLPNGYAEPLVTRTRSLEESVDRIVTTCFLLDTLARQNGYNSITVHAYHEVAPHLPFYPETLADEPFAIQLMEYLEAPTAPIRKGLPRWSTAAVLRPDPADVTLLPSLLDSLARIQVAESPPPPGTVREQGFSSPLAVGYTHSEVPAGGVALRETAFEHRLTGDVPEVDKAVVAIVTTDPTRAERLRSHLDRAPLQDVPERIEVHEHPTTQGLRALLESEADLLVTDLPGSGATLACADGALDLADVDLRPTAVVLDSATAQTGTASALVDAGATVAMAASAVTTPEPGLRLLGCLLAGHSLVGAAELVYDEPAYTLTGVPTAAAVRLSGGVNAAYYRLDTVGPDEFAVRFETSPTRPCELGGVNRTGEAFSHGEYQLAGASTRMPATISTEQVLDLLTDDDAVIVLDGKTYAGEVTPGTALIERSVRREVREKSAEADESANTYGRPIE